MTSARETIRIVIPLSIKPRNGRPRIMPPGDTGAADCAPTQDAHLVRAIARA